MASPLPWTFTLPLNRESLFLLEQLFQTRLGNQLQQSINFLRGLHPLPHLLFQLGQEPLTRRGARLAVEQR
jgi:hypothetical protein